MAEFTDLGENCSFQDCNTLDFLPFACSHCNCIFCRIHKPADAHKCEKFERITQGSDTKASVTIPYNEQCVALNCSKRELTDINCEFCRKPVCLQHRFPHDHDCSKLHIADVRVDSSSTETTTKVVPTFAPKRTINPKHKATALKIAIMRLKQKAIGECAHIATEQRVYFEVQMPPSCLFKGQDVVAVFLSNDWTAGRAVDSLAKLTLLSNENNRSDKPKLRLYLENSLTPLPMDTNIGSLVESEELIQASKLGLVYDS